MILNLILVAVGSAIGGVARYLLSYLFSTHVGVGFPWATLTINASGCLLIGVLYGLTEHSVARNLVGVGILGGYTTFSTFSWEAMTMLQDRRVGAAMTYIGVSLFLGLLLVWVGWELAQTWRR